MMKVHFFVDQDLIPEDGSKQIIEKYMKEGGISDNLYIFPDVHYKKGSKIVNGILIESTNNIYLSCLGVENCGFTVGTIESDIYDEKVLVNSFNEYVNIINNGGKQKYSISQTYDMFMEYLKKDYESKKDLYTFLQIKDYSDLKQKAKKFLKGNFIKCAADSLGNMGGGNHFFEIHKVIEDPSNIFNSKKIYILHSDSVSIGDRINLIFSNLSILNSLTGMNKFKKKFIFRIRQILYFTKRKLILKSFRDLVKLLFCQDDYRTLDMNSLLGKELLFAHNMASVFGEMNRDCIINEWATTANLRYKNLFSNSHDNVSIENIDDCLHVIHRNGVQYVDDNTYYALPGAMGNGIFIMENPRNQQAFFSANHGTGRMQDKHIAREQYGEEQTVEELMYNEVHLFRIGNGNINEQNRKAFKNMDKVAKVMEQYDLGKVVAKTKPIAVIKG